MSDVNSSDTFDQVLAALLDQSTPFPPKYLHRFSDLNLIDARKLKSVWNQVEAVRRGNLMEDLEEITETDTLVSFDEICEIALNDSEPRTRAAAIRMLWESEKPRFIPHLIRFLKEDPEPIVRSASAATLGVFVYKGELDEIDADQYAQVQNALLDAFKNDPEKLVRRRALEALGYSSHAEVNQLILNAYRSDDEEWVSSALFAMGKSADERWEKSILKMFQHESDEVRAEAIRAAGELEMTQARTLLLDILEEPDILDEEVRLSTIWALSKIGGEGVRKVLEKALEEAEDEEEQTIIEQALENMDFLEGLPELDLFKIDEVDDEALKLINLNDELDEDSDLIDDSDNF